MTTLATLKTNIALRMKDEGNVRISAANVVNAVNQAIRFWKRRPLWFNEFSETITIASGANNFSLVANPSALFLFADGGMAIQQDNMVWPMRKVSTVYYDRVDRQGTGRPYCWCYRNQQYRCYFYADQDYTAIARGLKEYDAFATDGSSDASSNDFTNNAQDLIEYEAMARLHVEILQDPTQGKIFADLALREYGELKDLDGDKSATGEIDIHSLLV